MDHNTPPNQTTRPARPDEPGVDPLQRRHPNGLSVQEALDSVARGEHLPALGLRWPAAAAQDEQGLLSLRSLCDRLASQWRAIGQPSSLAALQLVHQPRWSARWQQQLLRASQQLQQVAEQTAAHAEQLRLLIGLPPLVLDRKGRIALAVLVRCLPQARGHDWRFMLRPDAGAICARLRDALKLLNQQRQLSHQISAPWSDPTLQQLRTCMALLLQLRTGLAELPAAWPSDLYSALVHGVGLLSTHVETAQQLAASYTPEVSQLDVGMLLDAWENANRKVWPASWMGRRRVLALLRSVIQGPRHGRLQDVVADLRRLVRLRQLATELAALQPLSNHADLPWSDLQTPLDEARAALAVQTALRHAHSGTAWYTPALEDVMLQHAGSPMADTARRLCALHVLQQELDQQSAGLAEATQGLWNDRQTHLGHLEAALAYQQALQSQQAGTDWPTSVALEQVAQGDCGAALATDLQQLHRVKQLQAELAVLEAPLRAQTDGFWQGQTSDSDDAERALKCHGSLSAAIGTLAVSAQTDAAIRQALAGLLVPGTTLLTESGALISTGRGYLAKLAGLPTAIDNWATHVDADPALRAALNDCSLDLLMTHAHELQRADSLLQDWCRWRQTEAEAGAIGLGPLVQAFESGQISIEQLRATFEADYSRWWLQSLAQNADALDQVFAATQYDDGLHDRFGAPTTRPAALAPAEPNPDDNAPQATTVRLRRRPVFQRRERRLPLAQVESGSARLKHLS
ncbi:MAG: hypothetical protein AB3X44_02635 [Leptothrix sp. (in: b-proteobacteria)]